MEHINKEMAFELIEDALMETDLPHGCGIAVGLCGAFYMCGVLDKEEWEAFLERIPVEPCPIRNDVPHNVQPDKRYLN